MVDVFHHIADRARYLKKLKGSLKPGRRIAIIDFRMDSPDRAAQERAYSARELERRA